MLSGEDIICFTMRPWHSTWKTDQKVMSRLATANRVLYVDPPRSLSAALGEAMRRTPRRRVVEEAAENLLVYQEPVFLPAWGRDHLLSGAYNRVIEPLRLRHLRHTANRRGFGSPILWSYTPLSSGAIGALGEKLVVYCVLDNYDECFSPSEVWHRIVRATHREMMRRADVVFAVSERLLEQCLQYNRNSYLVPNGVSAEAFEAAARNGSTPQDVLPIPRPIVGFVGVLHATIDFGLLEMLARSHPEWSLMLVGPVESLDAADIGTFEGLRRLPNVYYLGAKPPDPLPDYVNSCDVGLIPYRINTFTSFGDPQKLYEYFACGKPVVSTAMPSVRRFSPLARVADSPEGFVAAVEEALARPDGQSEARMSLARSNSWEQRIDEMSAILARHMGHGAATGSAVAYPAVPGTR